MPTALPFQLSVASLLGAGHREGERNNQDAFAFHEEPDLVVAAVCDGCSSSPRAEVGAALGARWLAEWVPQLLRFAGDPHELMDQTKAGLLELLEATCAKLRPRARDRVYSVQELFLFTYLVAVVDAERVICFGQGDGLAVVNGTVTVLDPSSDGAPPYLAYALVRDQLERDPGPLEPTLIHAGPTAELDSLLIATDGALVLAPGEGGGDDGLTPLLRDGAFARDPQALGKHLRARASMFHDDTTVALFRRR